LFSFYIFGLGVLYIVYVSVRLLCMYVCMYVLLLLLLLVDTHKAAKIIKHDTIKILKTVS